MRKFNIPENYRSDVVSRIKNFRKDNDKRKQDFSPLTLQFEKVNILIPRHFGFCFGVENAIEIAYKTINENLGKKIYLLSEMIHNPGVNEDLISMGVKFIFDKQDNQIIPWENISEDDIVLIPAFGTTVEIEEILISKGISTKKYNTTCPFVEKVWNKASALGKSDHTVIIHGKSTHEETKATFSHANQTSNTLIVKDIDEAKILSKYILGEISEEVFYKNFANKVSENFNPNLYLKKVGVVNQTTMLATETQAIANLLKKTMIKKYGQDNLEEHFADTRDTLCYATNDNQQATLALQKEKIDLAIVVGGYNSSNTTHIVELLENYFPTYFINDSENLISFSQMKHFDIHNKEQIITDNYLSSEKKLNIAITSGASCPDSVVDNVILKLLSFYNSEYELNDVVDRELN